MSGAEGQNVVEKEVAKHTEEWKKYKILEESGPANKVRERALRDLIMNGCSGLYSIGRAEPEFQHTFDFTLFHPSCVEELHLKEKMTSIINPSYLE